ncbi:hypothetical protein MSAN_00233500 [Mycena sanguinolenta]|uniref:Uncharacterized protein n=1 Tax=Mycena sanguinolenta TaxID=230812 RepID=A0A8H6ZFL1_9AGAR|nr:hypothetical protein MSAN_00233500 [Mycena sanguinolenta]
MIEYRKKGANAPCTPHKRVTGFGLEVRIREQVARAQGQKMATELWKKVLAAEIRLPPLVAVARMEAIMVVGHGHHGAQAQFLAPFHALEANYCAPRVATAVVMTACGSVNATRSSAVRSIRPTLCTKAGGASLDLSACSELSRSSVLASCDSERRGSYTSWSRTNASLGREMMRARGPGRVQARPMWSSRSYPALKLLGLRLGGASEAKTAREELRWAWYVVVQKTRSGYIWDDIARVHAEKEQV